METKILVINAGSSSLKYQLIDMNGEKVLAKGICDRIGPGGHIKHVTADGRKYEADVPMPTHAEAFDAFMSAMTGEEYGVIRSLDEITAVGHRIVQGGAIFKESCLVNEKVIEDIEALGELAPLHNPAHVLGIRACIRCLGDKVPQVVVFDTSFHATMPPKAYMFALPYEYYTKYQVRKYGAHGTSHRYVSGRCAELIGKKGLRIVTCHLGNGCSISAVKDGVCIDTTMGLTPLDGLMMGTRSGAVDPSAILYLMDKEGLTPAQMSDILNKKSGALAISGVSNDNRDICEAAFAGNERAALSRDMQNYQIEKYIGAFAVAMGGLDAIVFTGGIGENSWETRGDVCHDLGCFGVKINDELNRGTRGKEVELSTPDSPVRVFIIPTEEELMIARDTLALLKQ